VSQKSGELKNARFKHDWSDTSERDEHTVPASTMRD